MRTLALVLAGVLAFAATARAQWVERPFDPPAGSRWIIQSDDTIEDNRDGRVQTSTTKITSELTIEQKTGDGFRVTHVVRSAAYQSDASTAAVVGPIMKGLENLVVHATIGPNGTPLRVENLEEVQAAARTMVDRLIAPWADKPAVAEAVRQMATGILIADEQRATRIYLGELPLLALGQNTGLQPGETRRSEEETPNPLGPAVKSTTTLRIERADAGTGNVRLVRTRTFDENAIKEFMNSVLKQGGDAGVQQFESAMQKLALAFDSRAEIDVEGGMTRAVREDETTTANLPGHSTVKHQHKMVTVKAAP